MDTLLNNDSLVISRTDSSIQKTELELTKAYLAFYKTNRDKTNFAHTTPEKAIPVKKENTLALAEQLLQDSLAMDSTTAYARLKMKLKAYLTIAKDGPWPPLTMAVRKIKKGSSSPAITQIRRMLQRSGELNTTDTSAVLNDTLISAIKQYQQHNGMQPNGSITDSLIRSLNVPFEQRIQQLVINLYRAQWMPAIKDSSYITVNIPEFQLWVIENGRPAFNIPVAVGKEGTHTTMFTGNLSQVVFSPYWNIPASIVKNEILPKMKADKNYLKSRNMEIVGKNDSVPAIRQLPGKQNALGRVKFLFPNRYDIYFHDTYAKEIFNKQQRTISHGCIRLQDAEKLATYLLRNSSSWTPDKISAAMNSGKEQSVKVSPAMPVIISYYTTWVDETGNLHFAEDIYGNDKSAAQMLFEPSAQPQVTVVKDTVKSMP
jgi:murein L,D-transpeptidase YcbB/YkuD